MMSRTTGLSRAKGINRAPSFFSRPIFNLSFVLKLMERLVVNRFNLYVNQQYLLPVYQSAYRPNHSMEMAIVIIHNDIVQAMNNGDVSVLILLDLSSAIDIVDHAVLLAVLEERFCIKNIELEWFRPYLSVFCVASQTSASVQLTCSMPQGSVIDPQRFVAYMKDSEEVIDPFAINHHLYADDRQLQKHMHLAAIQTNHLILERCIAEIKHWCSSRRLKLKDEGHRFSSRANLQTMDTTLQICSTIVQPVTSVRNLGVYIDSELSKQVHIGKD